MDTSIFFSGFAGSILTAIVAIAGPYIAHIYTVKIVSRTPPEVALPPLAGYLTKVFGAFEIPAAKRFTLSYSEAYSDPHLDLVLGVGLTPKSDKFFSCSDPYFNLTLPGAVKSELIENPMMGWSRVFDFEVTKYRLTLLEKRVDEYTFELRRLSGPQLDKEGPLP